MKLLNKIFKLNHHNPITTEDIEGYIKNKGYEPLRWAIIKADNSSIIIESTVIESEK